jgi:hypothetical protein
MEPAAFPIDTKTAPSCKEAPPQRAVAHTGKDTAVTTWHAITMVALQAAVSATVPIQSTEEVFTGAHTEAIPMPMHAASPTEGIHQGLTAHFQPSMGLDVVALLLSLLSLIPRMSE